MELRWIFVYSIQKPAPSLKLPVSFVGAYSVSLEHLMATCSATDSCRHVHALGYDLCLRIQVDMYKWSCTCLRLPAPLPMSLYGSFSDSMKLPRFGGKTASRSCGDAAFRASVLHFPVMEFRFSKLVQVES